MSYSTGNSLQYLWSRRWTDTVTSFRHHIISENTRTNNRLSETKGFPDINDHSNNTCNQNLHMTSHNLQKRVLQVLEQKPIFISCWSETWHSGCGSPKRYYEIKVHTPEAQSCRWLDEQEAGICVNWYPEWTGNCFWSGTREGHCRNVRHTLE